MRTASIEVTLVDELSQEREGSWSLVSSWVCGRRMECENQKMLQGPQRMRKKVREREIKPVSPQQESEEAKQHHKNKEKENWKEEKARSHNVHRSQTQEEGEEQWGEINLQHQAGEQQQQG